MNLKLTHQFIIPESVIITYLGETVEVDSIDWIYGNLIISKDYYGPQAEYKVHYNYFPIDLPIKVGPKWKFLPYLDLNDHFSERSYKPKLPINDTDNPLSSVYSTGTIHRKLNISPIGGSDFSGGLNMQLNGNIGENLQISGVLSDSDLPLQAEGTTKNLENFDQVYLNISHPNYSADAGDLIYNYKYAHRHLISRKLVGLKNNFQVEGWKGSAVYAGSKGTRHSQKIKGRDGEQGPYSLKGKDGNKDIIILSGSEKIWVDGNKLVRGYNHDYTIDYSMADVYFTANILIHSDTDIYFEFQYSDNTFSKGFTGGTLEKDINQNGKFSMGLFQEKDQFNSLSLIDTYNDSLINSKSSSTRINTAQLDEMGDYVSLDSVYVYDPEHSFQNNKRYHIIFYHNNDGSYSRKISKSGRIYYQFIDPYFRTGNIDLYSPYKQLNAPENQRFGFIQANYSLSKNLLVDGMISGSSINQNTLSFLNYSKQDGIAHELSLDADSLSIGPLFLHFNISDWFRDKKYQSIGQETNIRQQVYWNENNIITNGIRETDLKTELLIPNFGTTLVEKSYLNTMTKNLESTHIKQFIYHPNFNRSFLDLIQIEKPLGIYKQILSRFNYHIPKYSPFLTYKHEHNPMNTRYNEFGGGLKVDEENRNLETGIQIRTNEVNNDTLLQYWNKESDDIVGFFNYTNRKNRGWIQDIIFKRRFKSFVDNSSSYDYSLSRIRVAYQEVSSAFKMDFTLKTEESFSNDRTVVYDSLGPGLGQFRYDPKFNTYIPDQNGSYIAYTIQTGQRYPSTVVESVKKIAYDLGNIEGMPELLFRFDSRINFKGRKFLFKKIMEPDLSDSSLSDARILSRLELEFYGHNRALSWLEINRSFSGVDPRGNDLKSTWESGINITKNLMKEFTLQSKSRYRSTNIRSTTSILRNRSTKGWWQEMHILFFANNMADLDFGVVGGKDEGVQKGEFYSARALGFSIDGRLFILKKGRFQSRIERINITANKGVLYLPPEALKGYPVGIGIRSNTRFQYFINRTVSFTISMNTIHDKRYKRLTTVLAEVRAQF